MHLEENIHIRRLQLRRLIESLNHHINNEEDDQVSVSRLILGDFNFHGEHENELLNEHKGYYDVWTSLHSASEGITWDGVRNPLIDYYIPG